MTEFVLDEVPDTIADRGVWSSLRVQLLFWVCSFVLGLLGLIALLPGPITKVFGQSDPRACDLRRSSQGPSSDHVFGTDLQGCDIFANVIYGTRTSLFIGLATTAMCLFVALIVGTIAGYYGGPIDTLISRLTDIFLGFPFILGAIIVLNSVRRPTPIVVSAVLALFVWPTMSRLVRGAVRAVRRTEYVHAASAMGLSDRRILTGHVMPNSLGPVLSIAATVVGSVIVAESTLTFLGVGLRAPSISWGLQLANAQSQFAQSPHLLIFPALFLSLTVLALVTLGDILRDALDPKGRQK